MAQNALPDQAGAHKHELISSGKNSAIYLVDRDHMGHFQSQSDDQIVQAIPDAFSTEGFTGGDFTARITVSVEGIEAFVEALTLEFNPAFTL